jgi:hypothetical protein
MIEPNAEGVVTYEFFDRRGKPTKNYTFAPDADGNLVAEVTDQDHLSAMLRNKQHFLAFGKDAAAMAADAKAKAEAEANALAEAEAAMRAKIEAEVRAEFEAKAKADAEASSSAARSASPKSR